MIFLVYSSFNGIFSASSNPLIISVVRYPFSWRLCLILWGKFFWSFYYDYGAYSMCLGVKDGFYTTFEVEVLFGVCGFVINVCNNLDIFIFMEMSKNGSFLKLCSMVNFILECRFWSKLCKLLMSPHRRFQDVK